MLATSALHDSYPTPDAKMFTFTLRKGPQSLLCRDGGREKPDFLQMLNDVIQENYKLKNKNLSPSNAEIKSKENEIEPD
jgi:hypothetical protein